MASSDVKTISYEEIKALLGKSQNLLIVDVRKEEELEKGHIPGSVNIPIDTVETALSMEPEMFKAKYGVNKPSLDSQELVFHCFMGKRGNAATETANKLGYVHCSSWALVHGDENRCSPNQYVKILNIYTTSVFVHIISASPVSAALVLAELKESALLCALPCPQPDPEELFAFADLYGSLRLLLSFQLKNTELCSAELCAHIEAFLRTFSLANAGIKIHFKIKLSEQTFQQELRVKVKRKIACANQMTLMLDVTSRTQPPEPVKNECWCQGGHPVLGGLLRLIIPPEVMDQGLFGELSIQPVALLRPCLLQYPNLATQLTHIQISFVLLDCTCVYVLVCSPSNVPVTGPSTFFHNLPAHLDCQDLELRGLHHTSFKDQHCGAAIYTVEQENCEEPEREPSLHSVPQSLLLFLFLQHNDPFTSQLSDIMVTEVLIEHHLEDILNHNRQTVTAGLQCELKNALKDQHHRKKDQEKMQAATEVILSSCVGIMSCSSDMDFRNACLDSMEVRDTYQLTASLRKSLRKVTSWKFTPRSRCYSAEVGLYPESDEPSRTEI
ncbi:uncharacterized protein V6R79_005281 [Siganus canaliculatus]